MSHDSVSRRDVLKGVGAGLAGTVAAGTASGREQSGELLVGFNDRAAARRGAARADEHHDTIDLGNVRQVVHGNFSAQAVEALRNNPHVEYVEENGEMRALAQTLPWGIDRVDADLAQADGFTGDGADVAILDTGIDSDHPDLKGNIAGGKCFADDCCGQSGGCRFGAGPNDNTCNQPWDDDNDHGTHCAGTADAVDNSEGVVGVATQANLWAGKVLNGCGSGSYSNIAQGIKWTADQGFDVASMSLGGSDSSTMRDACKYAYDNGVLLVAAAGNDGPCTDCVGYPAAYSTVIAVSATTKSDSLADFSSTGPEVELAAPGKDVYSTIPGGYDTFSGTSMACPHVSGAGGILMANGQTNTEARSTLQDTAEDIGLASNEQGYGLLDAEAAANSLSTTNSAPAVDSLSVSEVETSDSDAEFDVSWQVSDADGNLSSVDLALTDDTDAQSEDSATVSVSGDSASGTTRLVAASDDGSGNSYTVDLTVTDGSGATASSSATVTEAESNSSPTVDSLSASEVETSDGDAEFDVSWQVSDVDGNLSSVDLALTDDTAGESEDSATVSVSGDSASGTTRLVAAGDDGSGNSYTVDLTVTDADGVTASGSTSVAETENSAPTIDTFSLTNDSNPAWTRYYVDWGVSDVDSDLSSVTTEMLDSSGNVLASDNSSVSGSSASGTHYVESKSTASEIRLTVTDSAGNATSSSKSV